MSRLFIVLILLIQSEKVVFLQKSTISVCFQPIYVTLLSENCENMQLQWKDSESCNISFHEKASNIVKHQLRVCTSRKKLVNTCSGDQISCLSLYGDVIASFDEVGYWWEKLPFRMWWMSTFNYSIIWIPVKLNIIISLFMSNVCDKCCCYYRIRLDIIHLTAWTLSNC